MTAAEVLAACDFCAATMPASAIFRPIRGVAVNRCRDTGACERRALRSHDPTLLSDDDQPVPPAAGSWSGAACAVCGASDGLYERVPRSGQYVCIDRDRCARQSIDQQYLRGWGDSSPDRLITASDMRAMTAAAGAVVPAERPAPDPGELMAEQWRAVMGRKREQS